MTRIDFFALSLLLVAGCAASPDKQLANSEQKVCTREYKVGSNIPVLNCEAPKSDEERQQMIDEVKNGVRSMPQRAPSGVAGG